MPFKRDSLSAIQDRVYANYTGLFRPLAKTPRHSLLKVLAQVDAGIYHQLLGDLDFLALQLFPDTATGEYLRDHWSSRVTPLAASRAAGAVDVSGLPNAAVPSGLVFRSSGGSKYHTERSHKTDGSGRASVPVKAAVAGLEGNLQAGDEVKIISVVPSGIDTAAVVAEGGISGGADAETDAEYLARVLLNLRNPVRYGKAGDWAAWAMDSSPEVSAAWEFANFGPFGAILVQVINGNQNDGVSPVGGLAAVREHISENAPFVTFDVRTPVLVSINPVFSLPPAGDSQQARILAESRTKAYLQRIAKPGCAVTAGALRLAIVDGVDITDVVVKIDGSTAGVLKTTVLQYPVPGEISWE